MEVQISKTNFHNILGIFETMNLQCEGLSLDAGQNYMSLKISPRILSDIYSKLIIYF